MSSLFTFGNIGTATDGQPVSPVSEVRPARTSCSLPLHGRILYHKRAKRADVK